MYGRCVYKFDHYCVWIGNCVGGLNHRYFVALLLSLSLMCLHGVHGVFNVFTALLTVQHQLTTPYHSVKVHTSHTVTVCKAGQHAVQLLVLVQGAPKKVTPKKNLISVKL